MKKIAIIGASGFVGSALLDEALRRGHGVIAIVRHPEKIGITDPKLTVVAADVSDADAVARAVAGCDAVISAFNPGWDNPGLYDLTLSTYAAILRGVKKAGIDRLLVVGGAGSLYVAPDVRVMDTGAIPPALMPGVRGLADVYYDYLIPEKGLDWVFFSPAGELTHGQRTGTFRLGKDDLITDSSGHSRISVEDYALAMLDELERPRHHRERFTIGY